MTKHSFFCKFFTRYDQLGNFEFRHILGWGLATLSFDKYKIAQTFRGGVVSYVLKLFLE